MTQLLKKRKTRRELKRTGKKCPELTNGQVITITELIACLSNNSLPVNAANARRLSTKTLTINLHEGMVVTYGLRVYKAILANDELYLYIIPFSKPVMAGTVASARRKPYKALNVTKITVSI